MPAPKPSLSDIARGIARYESGDRPWAGSFNRVDWFIAYNGELYPLKYTFALAMNVPTTDFTTDEMKTAMRDLGLTYHSLKAQREIDRQFQNSVRDALADDVGRARRLQTADPRPKVTYAYQIVFQRNPDVVAEVLHRADGSCESCRHPAPFRRASDGSPYLEVHHTVSLAEGGYDTVSNAQALCPNCHRQKHYG